MKRVLKISLITIASILITLLITSSIILWLVFTPAKLTPIVRNQLANNISCQSEIGEVELTFFSSFPQFGIKLNGLRLINPLNGAPTDTLLNAEKATATIDIKALINKNKLIINSIELSGLKASLFTDIGGKTNYDVFVTDSTEQDSSAFSNPFDQIKLDKFNLINADIEYIDIKSNMSASIQNMDADLTLNMLGELVDARINSTIPDISFRMDSIDYLKNASIGLEFPFSFDFKNNKLALNNSALDLNNLKVGINGNVSLNTINDDLLTDLTFKTEKYPLTDLFKIVPTVYLTSLEGMKINGIVSTSGSITGIFNNNSMPFIELNADIEEGDFEMNDFPYKLSEMIGNADIKLNLNKEAESKIIINNFGAKTGASTIEGKGLIDYILMDDMLFDLAMKLNLNLPELKPILPEDMNLHLSGIAKGTASARFMLSDAMSAKLDKMNIVGQFDATQLEILYDSISMYSDKAKLNLKIPNTASKSVGWLNAGLWCDQLKVLQGKNTSANLLNVNLLAQTSDMMETSKASQLVFDFNFDKLNAQVDNILTHVDKSKGKASILMNFNDTISWPTVNCDFDVTQLHFNMDTINADIKYPVGSFAMRSDKNAPRNMIFDVKYKSAKTIANMGSQSVKSGFMEFLTHVKYDDSQTNTMLQWTPTGHVLMTDAQVKMDGLDANIQIPAVEFDFTPDQYLIKKGKLLVDNSDFELTGKLWNVKKYLQDDGLLMGDFKFKSNTTDVYRLMALTNGFGEEDSTQIVEEKNNSDKKQVQTETQSSPEGPYMVPKGIDLKLNAQIDNVLLGFDTAQNMLGELFIKDGLLVMEDLRFKTSAAKMQLTAMYRTPRKNHLFSSIDFHIMDMEISEMLKMIPDIDTIMPMLRSFGGKGEFHFAAETYMDSLYNIKKSTLRGASSIKGENLVLMDGETFSNIAQKLRFNKKTENKVDSLSAEFTIFRNEVDIYPFLIVMDKYKAVVAGRHNLDMSFDYHISLVDSPLPIQLGVDVKGTMDDMKIMPAACKYAKLYRPAQRREVDTKKLEIRKMIRDALMSKVIEQE